MFSDSFKKETGLWRNGLRLFLALAGGYAVAIFGGKVLAALLPLEAIEATAAGIMLGYVLFVLAGIWAFAASSLLRASLGLVCPLMIMGMFLALGGKGGAI